jgi:MATE family multidrug resistance protein
VSSPAATAGPPDWRREVRVAVRRLLTLAGPVVLAEIGWMSMGLVDTLMVGSLGPAAIGATGLGGVLFMSVAIFGMGLLLGLDTLVSQAFGARRLDECHRWLAHGALLAAIVAVPITATLWLGARLLPWAGLHPDVLALTVPYLEVVTWSLPPLLAYACLRRYLQGVGWVRPITWALLTANLVNAAANWLLIHGHLGMPALGVVGAAWATLLSRLYLAVALGATVVWHDRQHGGQMRGHVAALDLDRLRRLAALGVPAALQLTLEVGVFGAATALAGQLLPAALASHQIALNVASAVFMVPLGTASAAAVVVGHAIGRGDPRGATVAGWSALGLISVFMLVVAAVFVFVPDPLLRPFTSDPEVLQLGATLLLIAAVFQLFDGLQVVATGVLRGVGDTRTPMVTNLIGHWVLGLPVAYGLCFRLGWGVAGLWVGLSVGLVVAGIVLVLVWRHRVRDLRATARA